MGTDLEIGQRIFGKFYLHGQGKEFTKKNIRFCDTQIKAGDQESVLFLWIKGL